MTVDPQIVAELRTLFLSGATPSRLVRHIADRHEADPDWSAHVDPYFAEAFAVTPFVSQLHTSPVDLDRIDLTDLNGELLRDMVGRAAAWKDDTAGPTWCDGLAVSSSDLRLIDGILPESHPALADCWATLPPRAREFVRRTMVSAQAYSERTQVLMRLAERLQQQLVESERQVAGV